MRRLTLKAIADRRRYLRGQRAMARRMNTPVRTEIKNTLKSDYPGLRDKRLLKKAR